MDEVSTGEVSVVLAYRLCSQMGDVEAVTSTLEFAREGYDDATYTMVVTNALALITTRILPVVTSQAGDIDEFRSRCARLADEFGQRSP